MEPGEIIIIAPAVIATVADSTAMGVPAHNTRTTVGEAMIWIAIIVGIAYFANIARGSGSNEHAVIISIIDRIIDNGAFDIFAWSLVLYSVLSLSDKRPASRWLLISTILLGIVVLVPARLASAIALVLFALVLMADRNLPVGMKPVPLVLFALALETIWMSPLLAPVHVLVGAYDAGATSLLLRALGYTAVHRANVVDNDSTGFSIVIWPYCSSSLPLARVSLAFLVTVIYRGGILPACRLYWFGLSLAVSVFLTELRLMLLALNEASYQWWHAGPGVSIYALTALGAAVFIPLMATSKAGDAKPHRVAQPTS
jgi:hypothetical protein